ncbi:ROK family transcriptional regulator [Streptomyces sp. NBC_00193]|uniref:ROK family transcriptional regulator n=1 Tax=unclassified Streptomyces TaxID=2593676 RepID=UPI002258337B|nr:MULTISPECIES: ROK family transcriptional regulator [unclassified Streptomyces]MCX5125965.1 ROK family transcriptional regulator [Streptomyces sp. NBC_00347]MCX5298229.1 ROK family transcriptional regulator [Streptomyces sp. NBC_00193]
MGGGVNLPVLRGHNDALVLDLLRGAGPAGLGRGDLAARTGLTPQAVSKIAARLRDEGLVADAGREASTGGKPRTLLRLVPEARYAVGLHLDRDELTAVRVDLAGRVVAEGRVPLDFGAGPEVVVEEAVRAVARVCGDRPLLGVGVAAPGPLDWRTGVLGRVTGFPEWEGFPLREVLEGRLGVPVRVDKDTNAGVAAGAGFGGAGSGGAAFGEAAYGGAAFGGAAFGEAVAYVHVGTGLGAGLRLAGSGEVYRGRRSAAGEFGHQVLQLDGPACRCGGRGCAEVLCLDAVAGGRLEEAARIVGEAAANLVALLDVDRVVLGGRVVAAAPGVFLAGVREVLGARAFVGGAVGVGLAEGGVAEGAAELVLGPLFGRGA